MLGRSSLAFRPLRSFARPRLALLALVGANGLDWGATSLALATGWAVEQNPFARAAWELAGAAGLFGLKALSIGLILALVRWAEADGRHADPLMRLCVRASIAWGVLVPLLAVAAGIASGL